MKHLENVARIVILIPFIVAYAISRANEIIAWDMKR